MKKKYEETLPLDEAIGDSNNDNSGSGADNSFWTVMVPLGLYMAVFSIQAILVAIPEISPEHFLAVTLISLSVCGTCGAIATAGIVATTGSFPPSVGIGPFFSGQAAGGVAVAIANFAALAIGEDPNEYLEQHCEPSMNHFEQPLQLGRFSYASRTTTQRRLDSNVSCSSYQNMDWAVFCYFLAGCTVLLLCLVGYHKVNQYEKERHTYETVNDNHNDQQQSNNPSNPYSDEIIEDSPRIGLELNERIQQRQQSEISEDENDMEEDEFLDERDERTQPIGPKSVIPVIKGPATCIVLTFGVTLSIFPSWVSMLKSSHECENRFRLDNDLYVPFIFVFFNVGDLLGRLIAARIPVHRVRNMSRVLVVGALLRTVFFPAFLMCTSTLGDNSSFVVQNDFFSLLVQLLFAVSNGVLVSTAFVLSSQLAGNNQTLQERASEIMTFSISFGLLGGSFLAFPFLRFASHFLQ